MAIRLYVGNLPLNTSAGQMGSLFGQAGTVLNVYLPTDRAEGQPRGFGFVEMQSKEEARKAIQMVDGYTLIRRQIRVNEAQEPE